MGATITWYCACAEPGCSCIRITIGPVICAECAAGQHRKGS